ncbi:hypothetical protein AAHA92_20185 [Salvia divinorum]|uniref:Uncharacterized protein n=1 Tax=Salvia divinorum TaxID=28513 RepID=A0ABD1GJM5_SALDI
MIFFRPRQQGNEQGWIHSKGGFLTAKYNFTEQFPHHRESEGNASNSNWMGKCSNDCRLIFSEAGDCKPSHKVVVACLTRTTKALRGIQLRTL